MNKIFLVAGGDMRQIYAAEKLKDSFSVYITGFDKNIIIPENIKTLNNISDIPQKADYILLPMPVSTDNINLNTPFGKTNIPLSKITGFIKEDGIIFGGKAEESVKKIFQKSDIRFYDYLDREDFSVMNAVPTAEGALQIAFEELSTTIYGTEVLVTGWGRIAKILARMLVALGANVTVSARNYSDLTWAEIFNCHSLHISELKKQINKFDVVFNTVPDMIFDKSVLKKTKKNCLIIDLASRPGGVDFESASSLGIKTIWALGLPGKVAPVTSGKIVAMTVINILSESGDRYE